MISATEAREAVHVLLLRELVQIRDGRAVILKGGVNLRLFYGSPRYSEDMDLDGEPETRLAIRSRIRQIFDDREFLNVRRAYRSESRWDELRLRAGSLIEDVREEQERRA